MKGFRTVRDGGSGKKTAGLVLAGLVLAFFEEILLGKGGG